jgi:hypothetical protein
MAVPSISPSAWQIQDTSVWNGLLDSIQKGMMIGAMPAQNKADLQAKQLQNALAQINLQTQPQMNQAELALKSAQAADDPIKALGAYYGGMGRYNQASWNSSPNSQLIRVLNSPAFESLLSTNPDVAKQVTAALGGIGLSAGSGVGANPPAPNGPLTLNPQDLQNLAAAGNQVGASNQPSPKAQIGAGIPGSSTTGRFMPSAQDIQNLQQASGDALIHKTQTAQQQNQRMFGGILDNLFSQGDKEIPSVVKYAGVLGNASGIKEKAIASLGGETSDDYKNYYNFTHVTAPSIANEMGRVLGKHSTDYQQKAMKQLSDPSYWDSNPELAMGQWNAMTSLFKNGVNPVLTNNPSTNLNNMRNGTSSAAPQGSIARIKASNGKTYNGPADKLEAFIKAHPDLKFTRIS